MLKTTISLQNGETFNGGLLGERHNDGAYYLYFFFDPDPSLGSRIISSMGFFHFDPIKLPGQAANDKSQERKKRKVFVLTSG